MKKLAILVLIYFVLTACQPAPPPEPQILTPTSASTQPIPTEPALSGSGPWILLAAEDGLWVMNQDGSALTHLTDKHVIVSSDLKTGLSPTEAKFAFITVQDTSTLQGMEVNIITLPDGEIKTVSSLAIPTDESIADLEMCDPKHEAARAIIIGNNIAWAPDGSRVAFVAPQGESADVYVYSLRDETLTRVSDEPGQAYDLHWHSDGKTIVYFSASCFGTGAGFNMEGAWAVNLETLKTEKIYEINPESWGENFVTWSRSGQESLFVTSFSGCPQRDLRLVNISTREVETIFEGCFEDVAVGPTGSLAVLTSADFSEQPGLYLYSEPDITGISPVYAALENGRRVRYVGSQFLVRTAGENGSELHSFTWDGSKGWYEGQGDFPSVSRDETTWVWNEGGTLYLKSKSMEAPVTLSAGDSSYPFWYEELAPSGEVHQRLLFLDAQNNLYMLSSPNYQPVLLAENLVPLSAPIEVHPKR